MNRYERTTTAQTEAKLEFGDGEFRIVRPGAFVRCGVTGQPIDLDQLRYWNIALQEAYASPDAKIQRLKSMGLA